MILKKKGCLHQNVCGITIWRKSDHRSIPLLWIINRFFTFILSISCVFLWRHSSLATKRESIHGSLDKYICSAIVFTCNHDMSSTIFHEDTVSLCLSIEKISSVSSHRQLPTHQNMNKVGRCLIIYIMTSFCSSQLYKEIELCSKITKVIQFDRDESCMIGYGNNHLNNPVLFLLNWRL